MHVVCVGHVEVAVVVVKRSNQGDSHVEGFPGGVVKVWQQGRPSLQSESHGLKVVVGLLPDEIDLACSDLPGMVEGVVTGSGAEASVMDSHDTGECPPLNPSQTE